MPNEKTFSISETAGWATRTTFKHFGFFVLTFLFTIFAWGAFFVVLQGLYRMLVNPEILRLAPKVFLENLQLNPRLYIPALAVILVYNALQTVAWQLFNLGFDFVAFDIHDKDESKVTRLFSGFRVLHKDLGVMILLFLLMCAIILGSISVGAVIAVLITPFIGKIIGGILLCIGMIYIFYLLIRFSFYRFFIVDKNAGAIESLRASYALTRGLLWKTCGLLIVAGLLTLTIILSPAGYLMFVAAYRKLVPKS